ncbi:MAG: hypothetical protein H7328_09855 [Bdellovibrio sp.]|nr:hypothetical protein [Bdellovibrio sp.]
MLNVKKISEQSEHAFLIEWFPGESDLISEMVYRFKSNRCPQAWLFYSRLFANLLCDQVDISQYDALVPLPGSKSNSVHANIFAKNLSKILGLPVLNALYKSPLAQPQKSKSAKERRQSTNVSDIQRLELFTKNETSNLKLIYVDDIMTTGFTYKRSRQALQNKNQSLLVTLFFRPAAIQT